MAPFHAPCIYCGGVTCTCFDTDEEYDAAIAEERARRVTRLPVTHVAGIVFRVGGRVIQRCCVCGAKLCDNLRAAMPLNPDGSVPEFPVWEEMSLVRHEGNRWSLVVTEQADDGNPKLPRDSCIELVEE